MNPDDLVELINELHTETEKRFPAELALVLLKAIDEFTAEALIVELRALLDEG